MVSSFCCLAMQRDSRTLRSSFIPLHREKCCTYLVVFGARKQTEQTHTNIFLLPVLWSDARAPYRNTCGYRYHRTQGRPTRSWNHEFSKIGTQGVGGPFPQPSSARYGQNKHFSLADDDDCVDYLVRKYRRCLLAFDKSAMPITIQLTWLDVMPFRTCPVSKR